jgi:hypothetical protein
VLTHPVQAGARIPGKLLDLLEPERLFAATYAAGRIPALPAGVAWPMVALELAADAALLVLCGWGLVAMPRSRFADMLRVLVVAVVAVHGVTYSYPRYHVPLVIIGLGAAGYALTVGLPALRERRLSPRQWVPLAVVAAALLASWTRTVLLYVAYRS